MSRTIVQDIGPLYGEANTGSVWGQPNGSYALGQGPAPIVPPVNYSIAIDFISSSNDYVKYEYGYYSSCKSNGTNSSALCEISSQDIADLTIHLEFQLASDSDFSTIKGKN